MNPHTKQSHASFSNSKDANSCYGVGVKVSVIIPVYNVQDAIQRAVDSALNQKFPKKDFEVIVVNDGSTDKTLKILKTYKKRIRVIAQRNQGAVKAANKGFRQAKGDYVIKLDADDYFEPTILKEMAAIFDKYPKIDFVYCDYYEKSPDNETRIISTKNIFNILSMGVMFRRKKFAEIGFYDEKFRFAEYDLLLKIKDKWTGYQIEKPLFCYNRSKKSITGNKSWVKKAINQLKENYPKRIKEIKKIRSYSEQDARYIGRRTTRY